MDKLRRLIPSQWRLGEILIAAGIVSKELIDSSITVSSGAAMPVGRVLLMSKAVSERALDAALQAQRQVRLSKLQPELAIRAVREAAARRIDFDQALAILGWRSKSDDSEQNLTNLLVDAKIIGSHQMKTASVCSRNSQLPIGSTLVYLNAIPEGILAIALNLIVLIKDNQLCFADAVRAFERMSKEIISLDTALWKDGIKLSCPTSTVKLGDLLFAADAISVSDSLLTLEMSLCDNLPLGEVLLKGNFITMATLESALLLQETLKSGFINYENAVQLLRLVITMEEPLEDVLNYLESMQQIVDVFLEAELLNDDAIQQLGAMAPLFTDGIGTIVAMQAYFQERYLHLVVDCLIDERQRKLTRLETIRTIKERRRTKCGSGKHSV